MFGTPRRMPRPVLLIIVFGAFLVDRRCDAMAQTVMVSAQFTTSTLNSVVATDAALVRMFVTTHPVAGRPERRGSDDPAPVRAASRVSRP